MHHLRLLRTDGQAEVNAGVRELVNAVLHGGFRGSVERTDVGKKEVIDDVCRNHGFRLKPPEVEG